MKTNVLKQFFRDAARAIRQSPEVKVAVQQFEAKLATDVERGVARALGRYVDRFEPPRPVELTPAQRAANADYVRSLYRDLLGRAPDPEGFASHLAGLERGVTRAELKDIFLRSPEYQQRIAQPPAPPVEPPAPPPTEPPAPPPGRTYPEPGPKLSTVPPRPEYLDMTIDRSSPEAAAKSSAAWVKQHKPEYFVAGDDRQRAFEMMTWVIGGLRAAGFDAHRVVNHPSYAMGQGMRYGSDALVLNGNIYDVYGALGDPGRSDPQALNQGPSAAGRLRE